MIWFQGRKVKIQRERVYDESRPFVVVVVVVVVVVAS
jgi:hypothetical protein